MFQIDWSTRLAKLQVATFALTALANMLCFFATLTPSWQVAEDLDTSRTVQSGLWIYCQTSMNCWYIFSDNLINYYEKVDVCRFLLIADCRKKLLRTPYFFGWHYAVLIMMIIVLLLTSGTLIAIAFTNLFAKHRKVATIVMDALLASAFITLCIAIAVFVINAEMLESRYLIGVNSTYPKEYGYSFYLACLGLSIMLFAVLSAVMCTTTTLFANQEESDPMGYEAQAYEFDARGNFRPSYTIMKQQQTTFPNYAPSEASTLQTRTFISY